MQICRYANVQMKNTSGSPYLFRGSMPLYLFSISLNLTVSTGFKYAFALAGYFSNKPDGRVGRCSKPPPQLGQTLNRM